jgi:hypothetical protein
VNCLAAEFAHITVAAPVTFHNLTLFPLLRGDSTETPDYLLLEDAIAQGLARVAELSTGASVPELRFENDSAQPVVLLDGEELIGAKQNRVLNLTVLAPAKQTMVIPVSCVEAGRWHMEAPDFKPAEHVLYCSARAKRTVHVTESMRTSGTRRSNQSAIWDDIAQKSARMEAASPTDAISAVYDAHSRSIEEYVNAFTCDPQQAGVVFVIAGSCVGVDLFDHPTTCEADIHCVLVCGRIIGGQKRELTELDRACLEQVLGFRIDPANFTTIGAELRSRPAAELDAIFPELLRRKITAEGRIYDPCDSIIREIETVAKSTGEYMVTNSASAPTWLNVSAYSFAGWWIRKESGMPSGLNPMELLPARVM